MLSPATLRFVMIGSDTRSTQKIVNEYMTESINNARMPVQVDRFDANARRILVDIRIVSASYLAREWDDMYGTYRNASEEGEVCLRCNRHRQTIRTPAEYVDRYWPSTGYWRGGAYMKQVMCDYCPCPDTADADMAQWFGAAQASVCDNGACPGENCDSYYCCVTHVSV